LNTAPEARLLASEWSIFESGEMTLMLCLRLLAHSFDVCFNRFTFNTY